MNPTCPKCENPAEWRDQPFRLINPETNHMIGYARIAQCKRKDCKPAKNTPYTFTVELEAAQQ